MIAGAVSLLNMVGLTGLVGLLGAASATDLRRRIIPNGVVAAIAGLWAAWHLALGLGAGDWSGVASGLAGGLAIGGGLLAFTLGFERIRGAAALGGGDLKLMAACALYLGPERGAVALLIACVAGVVLAAIIPRTPFARADEHAAMPFGPAIALGTLAALLLP